MIFSEKSHQISIIFYVPNSERCTCFWAHPVAFIFFFAPTPSSSILFWRVRSRSPRWSKELPLACVRNVSINQFCAETDKRTNTHAKGFLIRTADA